MVRVGGTQDLFSGTAASLVRGGVNAVVPMQYEISDSAAIEFARGFYTALARGRGVDQATTSGRVAILGAGDSTLEWVTPVLYLRGDQTRLYAIPPATTPNRLPTPTPASADHGDDRKQVVTQPAPRRAGTPKSGISGVRATTFAAGAEKAGMLMADSSYPSPRYGNSARARTRVSSTWLQRHSSSRWLAKAAILGIPPIFIMLWLVLSTSSGSGTPPIDYLVMPICLVSISAGLGVLIKAFRSQH